MREKDLYAWQANALAEALWATHQIGKKRRYWQRLPPTLEITSKAKGVYDAARGKFDTEARGLGVHQQPAGPRYIGVMVPPLDACGIPEHFIDMMHSDYQDALKHVLTEKRLEAWQNYVEIERRSSVFWYERKIVRKKLNPEHTIVVRTSYVYDRVRRSKYAPKQLELAALALRDIAKAPSKKVLEQLLVAEAYQR